MAKLLIAEDSVMLQRTYARMVRDVLPGVEIVTANNGREAAELIQQDKEITFVLSDICMPEMNGDDLHRAIAPVLAQRGGVFVAMTGDCSTEQAMYFERCAVTLLRKGEFGSNVLENCYKRS